jgi:hypothetical protein
MDLGQFIIVCILVGAALYITQVLPIDGVFKTIIRVVVIVAFAIYAIKVLLPMAGLG